ncbi:phage antirepressor KilAC domain-containing protein [Paenibacillus xanthanilyticus]|uniref:phage antirepressor KilAC domain-containing protein n=1 Tax=Paenibacillus xanthanilyticus TaxID=1783531 RepID=UPI003636FB89
MTQLVFIEGGKAVTDSLAVAAAFDKEHRRVLQDIRDLGCSDEFRLHNFVQSNYTNAQGRLQPRTILTEQGFTLLAMGYTGPTAIQFKERYIKEFHYMREQIASQSTALVIPSYQIDDRVARAKQWIAEEETRQTLLLETQRQEALLAAQAPKITYYEQILRSDDAMNITQIAKDYGMTGAALNRILADAGVQYKTGGQWVLKATYSKRGYTKSETISYGEGNVRIFTKWTQKGRLFLHELLAKRGIVANQEPRPERKRRGTKRHRNEESTAVVTAESGRKITLNIKLEG